ncbi:MAG: DUF4124 domain-containing protein [Burkholderiales bacterium]|nr:DUF4124 domain-containing protein [Burkholderiales bacterium]
MKLMGRAPAVVLGVAIALALAATPAAAQWKWRDRSGQITVSDIPPPRDIPERDILERPPPPSARPAPAAPAPGAAPAGAAAAGDAAPAAGKTAEAPRVDPELEARRRAAEQEQSARQRASDEKLAAQRAENCRAARGHLAALESGQRLVRVNDKGEREFLDDRQRASEMQRARDVIASDCR